MCVLALYLPSFVVIASKGDGGVITRLSGPEKDEWLARFAFNLIAPALGLLETTADGHQMNHAWLPPSPHFQIELIAWLKVLEAPFDLDASGDLVLDVARVTRAILALGLIIEACYYLIDPTLRGKGNCVVQAAQKHGNDLEFGLPPGTLYPSRSSNW